MSLLCHPRNFAVTGGDEIRVGAFGGEHPEGRLAFIQPDFFDGGNSFSGDGELVYAFEHSGFMKEDSLHSILQAVAVRCLVLIRRGYCFLLLYHGASPLRFVAPSNTERVR